MTPAPPSPRLVLLASALLLTACGSTPSVSGHDAGFVDDDALVDAGKAPWPAVQNLTGGGLFTCASLADNTVRCWGENGHGQLGDRGTSTHTSAVVVEGLSGAVQVSAGYEHACARKSDGTVWCWGNGGNGRLGNGATDDAPAPVPVMGITNAVAVSAGYYHSCAVTSDGRALCWGRGSELGTGSVSSSNVPVAVMDVTGATDIAAGRSTAFGNSPTSCAVVAGGAVRCWGDGGQGQLGNGARDSAATSVAVTGITGARSVVVGATHACALLTAGTVMCWGDGSTGAVGPASQDFTTTPVAVTGLTGVTALAAGDSFTCALLTGATVRCWGRGSSGELGQGSVPAVGVPDSPAPTAVVGLSGVTLLGAGAQHVCAFSSDGLTRCWGSDADGQLGVGGDPTMALPSLGAPTAVVW